jgi:hypothetical protein
MNIYQIFLLLIYLILSVNSNPINEVNEGKQSYIVILNPKNTVSNDEIIEIVHEFAIGDNFRGYVGLFEPKFVEVLSKRDDVEFIVPDSEVQVAYNPHENDSINSNDFNFNLEEIPTWVGYIRIFFNYVYHRSEVINISTLQLTPFVAHTCANYLIILISFCLYFLEFR